MIDTLNRIEDIGVRASEGWDLFETGGFNHAPIEIQRDDCAGTFDDDLAAWRHVITQASAGRGPHVRALAYLALYSPEELVGIFYALYHGSYRTFITPENT